jgi:hypothetical protein
VRDQVSHPYSTTGKISVLYILIFRFFYMRREDWNSKHSLNLICSWFHHECHSDLLASSLSIWVLPHFQSKTFRFLGFILSEDSWTCHLFRREREFYRVA